ncbi:DUF6221 family protein [Nocardiopsis tropica]|uniref:DUF6221 family protein n=1 Tax=Nocardiopsis tropica TaxID=109330 RepID=A0ABU7KSU1_9ACTN|nr:DUF6221 family protein [Nocardiopsis umidischolae]MEE2051717.1 DUF6221 family protein [Nocardiopsis umidischolae]
MTDVGALVSFLFHRYEDEQERLKEVLYGDHECPYVNPAVMVLELEAKKRLLDQVVSVRDYVGESELNASFQAHCETTLKLLAMAYEDHEAFEQEWKVDTKEWRV